MSAAPPTKTIVDQNLYSEYSPESFFGGVPALAFPPSLVYYTHGPNHAVKDPTTS